MSNMHIVRVLFVLLCQFVSIRGLFAPTPSHIITRAHVPVPLSVHVPGCEMGRGRERGRGRGRGRDMCEMKLPGAGAGAGATARSVVAASLIFFSSAFNVHAATASREDKSIGLPDNELRRIVVS